MAQFIIDANLPYYFGLWNNPDYIHVFDIDDTWSDVDLAIVLSDKVIHTFDTDVQLMIIRKGEETIIEPHAFAKDEFNNSLPIYKQIVEKGIRIA